MMTKEKFISVLFHQQQSGLSIADFCENEGYSRSRFYLWKPKYGITERELLADASRLGVKDNFVSIIINGDAPSPGISHETSLSPPQNTVSFPLKGKDNSEISLELLNGLKLKFKGVSTLAEVLLQKYGISCSVLPEGKIAGISGGETVQKYIGRLVQTGLRTSQTALSGTQEESTGR